VKFAAVSRLRQLQARRDIDCWLIAYRQDGGAELRVLDLTRPQPLGGAPFPLTILPTGEVACECSECEALAA
jgi:hypothetical protein